MTDVIKCSKCGTNIDEPIDTPPEEREPCPKCGSTMRDKEIFVEEWLRVHEESRGIGKDDSGERMFNVRAGDNLFKLNGKYNYLERKFDWRDNWYYERIIDGETGDVIAYQDHPLSEHPGHGSARKKKKGG